ncbi:MAG: hypothetical protein ACJAYU_000750 [Bradymonadia bacterium]|jgi:hypothetical protein
MNKPATIATKWSAHIALTIALGLGVMACEPTPGYLERWANTPNSEDRFIEYLTDAELSHEVHVTALELLIEQWDYSASSLYNGGLLLQVEDVSSRDAILRDATPKIRDAAYHLRAATSNEEVIVSLDAIIIDWIGNHWDPCQMGLGVVQTSELLSVAGVENAQAKVIEVVSEGTFERLLCFGREVQNLEWLRASNEVAQAYISRWEDGEISENPQLRFEFFEHLIRFRNTEVMRTWMFQQIAGDGMEALYKNAILDALSDDPTDEDIEGYITLLSNETYARWSAFQSIVEARGSDGLEAVLTNLPPTGEYGFYDGAVRPDGLKSVTSNFLCELTKLVELGDNARSVFERHITDENVNSRLISVACLAKFGERSTISRLTEVRDALGADPVPAPGFGTEASVQSVIDDAIAAISARLAHVQQ